jgi:hypothetical protein
MRQVACAAALSVVLAGCGGQQMLAPSTPSTPNTSLTPTMPAHAQGALCDYNAGADRFAGCAAAGITATAASVPFHVSQGGTIQLSAITRYLGFEEYSLFRLTCDGVDSVLTAVSGKPVAQPAWFASVPAITAALGAIDLEYTARVPANSSCDLNFRFDLDSSSLPYTPYDVTVKIEIQ